MEKDEKDKTVIVSKLLCFESTVSRLVYGIGFMLIISCKCGNVKMMRM